MNLFNVVDTKKRETAWSNLTNKQYAKETRDKLNAETGGVVEGDNKPRFVVARGPDHWRGETDGFDHDQNFHKWLLPFTRNSGNINKIKEDS